MIIILQIFFATRGIFSKLENITRSDISDFWLGHIQSLDALRPIVCDYRCLPMEYIIRINKWYHIIYLHYSSSRLLKDTVLTIYSKQPEIFGRQSNGTVILRKIHSKIIDYLQKWLFSFHSERNGGNFLTICNIYQFTISHQPKAITGNGILNSYGKRHLIRFGWWFWKNPHCYSTLIPTGLSDKWQAPLVYLTDRIHFL